jgi:DNA replication and repair protein RecF
MILRDIRLQHFRSYEDESFEFNEGVNIIVGPNASGKTNLLEAILVIARGASYRVRDAELIQHDQPWARIDSLLDISKRTVKLTAAGSPDKTYELDGKVFRRLTMQHMLPIVVFEPNHLFLLHGSPGLRREYLDGLLEQLQPGFLTVRREYRRALAQRNALLKRGESTARQLIFPWNIRLSELGGKMVQARLSLVTRLNNSSSELYSSLARKPAAAQLHYQSALPVDAYESAFLKKLEQGLERDILRGFTSSGPHREDFYIELNGHPMQLTASRGEIRTAVLMLKILELQQIETIRDIRPLLLLDDVFSELDGARRQALTTYLQAYQTFMTTTDADAVVDHFLNDAKVIPLG